MNATGGGVNASQTVSLNKKCQDLILKSASLPPIRDNVLIPVLEYLAKDSKLTLKDAPIKVMWQLFRQGSFMCELLNQVQPGVIKSVSLPQTPMNPTSFTDTDCRQNVAAFIKASREMFFITDDGLFSPGEIYKDDFNAFSKAMVLCEMYLNNKIRVSTLNSYNVSEHFFDPEIVHLFDISKVRTESINSSTNASDSVIPKITKRDRILEEMIASERVYVDDLARLNKFKDMIKSERLLSQQTISLIFANLKDLLNFQSKFMIDMETEIQKENPDFGSLFTLNEADFKLYEDFCLNHSVALETLKDHKKILEARPDLSDGVGDIQGYLIKPIQRVTRYSLFMRDLNKEAIKNSNEAEVKSTEVALESVKRIANRINERQRAADNESTSVSFFAHFQPNVLSPEQTGKLVLHDSSVKLKFDDELKVYQIFLFQKMLIICTEKESYGARWMKNKIANSSIKKVRDLESGEVDVPYEAQITFLISNESAVFSLLFRTQQAQRMWINSLRGLAQLPLIEFKDVRNIESVPVAEIPVKESVPETIFQSEPVTLPEIEAPIKTRVEINFRDENYAISVYEKISLLELKVKIEDEIRKAYRLECKKLTDFPSIGRMRLRYKKCNGKIIHLICDEILEDLLTDQSFLDLIVFEDDPVNIKFTYRDCSYSFQVHDLGTIEQLNNYIYDTIIEHYRRIEANNDAVPKGDAMNLFVKDPAEEWVVLLFDDDLIAAIKASSNGKLDIKL